MFCTTKKISLVYFCAHANKPWYLLAVVLVYRAHLYMSTTRRMIINKYFIKCLLVCNHLLYGNYCWVVVLFTCWLLYPFNIWCIYRITAVYISCVIKFNSKRKLSNYIYRTTPLFLSTHQKNSTKNGVWVSCKCKVQDLLEHCMASCLGLLYIEITSYYYSGWCHGNKFTT